MNNVQLIGRLTSEPTIKKTSTGKSVANFNLAVRRDISGRYEDFKHIPVQIKLLKIKLTDRRIR